MQPFESCKVANALVLAGCFGLAGCSQKAPPEKPSAPAANPELSELAYRVERLEQKLNEPRVIGGQSGATISDEALIALLKSGDVELMRAGATLARKQPSPATQQTMIALARSLDRPQEQRQAMLYALQGVQAPSVQSMWIELLNDPFEEFGRQAADALQNIREPDPVPALLKAVENIRAPDTPSQHSPRKYAALNALVRLGDKRALPALLAALKSPHQNIRGLGLNGLVALKDENTREAAWQFFHALPEPPEANVYSGEHTSAIRLMKEFKELRAAPRMLKWVEQGTTGIRSQVADALPQVCGPETHAALMQLLKDEARRFARGDQSARQLLYQALHVLGTVRSAETGKAILGFLETCFDQQLAYHAVQQLHGAAVPELAKELIALHKQATDAGVKQELERLLKNGKFDIHWNEQAKTFGLGPPKVETELEIEK